MLIRQKLRLIILASGLVLAAAVAVFLVDLRQTARMNERQAVADGIIRTTADLRFLAVDYVIHREADTLGQWKAQHGKLLRLAADRVFSGTREEPLLDELRAELVQLERVFARIEEGQTAVPGEERQARLLSQVFIRSNEVLGLAYAARDLTFGRARQWRRRSDVVLLLLFGGLVAVNAVAAAVLTRSVGRPLAALEAGTRALTAGELSHRVPAAGNDELGALARAFNAMSGRLEETVAALRQRGSELEEANAELEAFAYSVSHDLRAPLRHTSGFVGLLRKKLGDGADPKTAHYLDVIEGAAQSMGRLVDDLLTFSRTGRAELVRHRVDPAAVVREALDSLRGDREEQQADVEVGPLLPVVADPAMLRVVLTNLLSNALKFTRGRERPVIEVSSRPVPGGLVAFSVKDNGVGFDGQYAPKLFNIFQRLHRADEFEGTGVGLAIVRRIVERHGGSVAAEGSPGAGATFSFTLPAAQEVEA